MEPGVVAYTFSTTLVYRKFQDIHGYTNKPYLRNRKGFMEKLFFLGLLTM